MHWTTEKPTVAGWYWWRSVNYRPKVVEVYLYMNGNCLHINGQALNQFAGEWAGPLSPPEA